MNKVAIQLFILISLLSAGTDAIGDQCHYDKKALILSVENSQNEKIMELARRGCDLKKIAKENKLDLFNTAVYCDNFPVVKLLVDQGVFVNTINDFGNLSISWCISLEMAEYLVSKGIDINFVDKDGWTPLHDFSSRSRPDIAKFLISRVHISMQEII